MSHVRTQIRQAVADALMGLPTTGPRVFKTRRRPLRDAELPCLLVNTDDEEDDESGIMDDCATPRLLTITVRGVVKDSGELDAALDQLAYEVEPVLNNNRLGMLVKSCLRKGVSIDVDDSLELPSGIITLTYQATYFTAPDQPGIAL